MHKLTITVYLKGFFVDIYFKKLKGNKKLHVQPQRVFHLLTLKYSQKGIVTSFCQF